VGDASALAATAMLHSSIRLETGAMSNKKKPSARAEKVWTRVMREGLSVDDVAREQQMSRPRLERILMALSKRRAQSLKTG
jgi:hypothetical protein